MALKQAVACDVCDALQAPFSLVLELDSRTSKNEAGEEQETVIKKRLDLCTVCAGRGLDILLKGLGHGMTRAWLEKLQERREKVPVNG